MYLDRRSVEGVQPMTSFGVMRDRTNAADRFHYALARAIGNMEKYESHGLKPPSGHANQLTRSLKKLGQGYQ